MNKISNIHILNKEAFNNAMFQNNLTDETVESYDIVLISINDSNATGYWDNIKVKNVLSLHFDDISYPTKEELESERLGIYKIFNEDMAKEVLNFLKANESDTPKSYIIHCSAGISRSGAIGTVIADMYGYGFNRLKRENPKIHPNSMITGIFNKLNR